MQRCLGLFLDESRANLETEKQIEGKDAIFLLNNQTLLQTNEFILFSPRFAHNCETAGTITMASVQARLAMFQGQTADSSTDDLHDACKSLTPNPTSSRKKNHFFTSLPPRTADLRKIVYAT